MGITGQVPAADLLIRDFEKPALGLVSTITPTVTATPSTSRAAMQPIDTIHCSNNNGKLAGVGVGIGIPLLIAFLTTLYLLRRSVQRQKAMAKETEPQSLPEPTANEPTVKQADTRLHEVPGNVVSLELPPHGMPHEMPNARADWQPTLQAGKRETLSS